MKKHLFLLAILLSACLIASSQDAEGKKQKKQKNKQNTETTVENTSDAENYDSMEGQEDSESDNTYVPGLLHSSKDVYENNTSYTFSIAYFKSRGYDNRFQNLCINGFQFNSLVTGRATYSQWGGLNHVMRYPESITGLNVCTFNFGDIGGASNYNTRASSYRKQIRVGYSLSNRNYTNRLMFTYATGVLKNGWSVAACLSTRFGSGLNYVDGVTYNGYSYFLSIEKKINASHALNLTAFGAPTVRGMQANSVQEAYDITGSNYYNPNWGWYQGKQRNARMRHVHEPVIQLTHYYTPDSKLTMTTTLNASFGRNRTTSLNWYDAQDPRPDYYRYLPSYQIENGDTSSTYWDVLNEWQNNASVRQIDWDRMYEVNQLAAYQGKRAQYMIENRVYDHYMLGGVTNAQYTINENIKFAYGVDIRGIKQRNYKTIEDLLGGLYWLDVDKYSEGDFPDDANVQYNDLDNKDKELHEGDVFGYDYDYHILIQKAWAQFLFNYNKVDFNIGASIGGTEFWRVGHMRNGRFQDDSKGRSQTLSFCEYAFKGGVTYKINGRNYLMLNGMFETHAPSVLNSFVAPRIRNKAVDNLTNEKISSVDLSYIMKYPVITMRLTAYFTQMNDMTKLVSFYHDGMQSMVNYSMTGIDQRHMGVELGAEIKLGSMFALILAGNYGDYRYSDRAQVTINAENGTDFEGDINRTVYWKNYHVAGSPQAAGTIGLKFNYKYWWVNINANYFDKIYCDLNPERRTTFARGSLAADDPAYIAMVSQTRLKGQFTLDASISKSWRIKQRYTIGFNISVTNITNNKNLITTAWEQYRYDYTSYNPDKFQNKYYYAFGTTFFAGLNFQFN
ncbi:MAG: TonB-dependent receptor [Bacteroidales bacterium]|nr:TonB-dependent receptor [Bacteroidales bacterium]